MMQVFFFFLKSLDVGNVFSTNINVFPPRLFFRCRLNVGGKSPRCVLLYKLCEHFKNAAKKSVKDSHGGPTLRWVYLRGHCEGATGQPPQGFHSTDDTSGSRLCLKHPYNKINPSCIWKPSLLDLSNQDHIFEQLGWGGGGAYAYTQCTSSQLLLCQPSVT